MWQCCSTPIVELRPTLNPRTSLINIHSNLIKQMSNKSVAELINFDDAEKLLISWIEGDLWDQVKSVAYDVVENLDPDIDDEDSKKIVEYLKENFEVSISVTLK